ncbi:MAG: hypothetical protein HOO06_04360 [Bdellovibrionaceae bacterium]|nr:hypothetical protein [Pseudobdellovibrionaceae bacterium]
MKNKVLLLFLVAMTLGCATRESTTGREDYDEGSSAQGHAYVVDAMTVRTPMPNKKPKWKPIDFYYKRCSEVGQKHPWTKTYYECNFP